jgi:myo-inositol catabolism protein IolC
VLSSSLAWRLLASCNCARRVRPSLTSPQNDWSADRAYRGRAKIKARLIGSLDPDDWDLPPKPKRMRWRTYNRHVERYDAYEDVLNSGIVDFAAKFMGRF